MEKFCQYIEKVLAQHDYVVVPNLGGFVVQLQSAELFSDHITPPTATIGFNPLMHHADGLLAIEIARSEQISYRLAMEYIEKEVENIISKLNSSKNVNFGNLGILYRNELGNLLFIPATQADFLPQNFELTNLYISQRNKQMKSDKPKLTFTLPSTRVFKYASVAMLIVGLFFVSPQINDMRQSATANLATSAFYNNSVQNPVTSTTTAKVKKTLGSVIPDKQDSFHVVVASLSTQHSADKFCEELIAINFPKAHVLHPTKIYRVAIQSFSDRDKAIQFMENLRKSDSKYKTAWVLCK